MTSKHQSTKNLIYECLELKLSSLLLSSIPYSSFDVYEQGNSIRKTIRIIYPAEYEDEVSRLEKEFINKQAMVNCYAYNKSMNLIRDRLRGENGNGREQAR